MAGWTSCLSNCAFGMAGSGWSRAFHRLEPRRSFLSGALHAHSNGPGSGLGHWLTAQSHPARKDERLEVHHIFPKAQLYKRNFKRPEVNALANFCFLTKDTNLDISDRLPEEYFPEIEKAHPGALASQWIPMTRSYGRSRTSASSSKLERHCWRRRSTCEWRSFSTATSLAGRARRSWLRRRLAVGGGIIGRGRRRTGALNEWMKSLGASAGSIGIRLR